MLHLARGSQFNAVGLQFLHLKRCKINYAVLFITINLINSFLIDTLQSMSAFLTGMKKKQALLMQSNFVFYLFIKAIIALLHM